ncbi:MAG: hypothetical protein ACYTEP_09120 [Planctomycetota bacterium]|jgi:hypothetical protein
MFAALLIQIVTLMPAAPEWSDSGDSGYLNQVKELASLPAWDAEILDALHATNSAQECSLGSLIRRGTDAEVRLASLLGAGVDGSSDLGLEYWRRAAMDTDETRALACLMAPASIPDEVLPMLAWIASDPRRSLPQRAAACARLIEAERFGAWDLAHSILRTGTAMDVVGPGADWKRGGRYELPKRMLLMAIQDLLQRHDLPPTDFEPNAPWDIQLRQLAELEVTMRELATKARPHHGGQPAWIRLLNLEESGDMHAQGALKLLSRP